VRGHGGGRREGLEAESLQEHPTGPPEPFRWRWEAMWVGGRTESAPAAQAREGAVRICQHALNLSSPRTPPGGLVGRGLGRGPCTRVPLGPAQTLFGHPQGQLETAHVGSVSSPSRRVCPRSSVVTTWWPTPGGNLAGCGHGVHSVTQACVSLSG
jgi:hypothetical protein